MLSSTEFKALLIKDRCFSEICCYFPNHLLIINLIIKSNTFSAQINQKYQITNKKVMQKYIQFQQLFNYIQMKERIRSAGTLLPQHQSILNKRKKQLEQYSKNIFFQHTNNEKNSSTPFTASSKRNHFLQNVRNLMTASPQHSKNDSTSIQRPFTERCQRRLQSPLQVIRSKSKLQSVQLKSQSNRPHVSPIIRVNFLRKGSSVDKAIIINILKSKMNLNICSSAFCYNDTPANKQLAVIVQKQIPKGIRDVVGVEQMMRMSHIMTGANFKSTSMTRKLNQILKQKKARKTSICLQDDDHLTLKSIKRW